MAFSEGMLDSYADRHIPEGLRPEFRDAIARADHHVVDGMRVYSSDSVDRALSGTRVDYERKNLKKQGIIASLLGIKRKEK